MAKHNLKKPELSAGKKIGTPTEVSIKDYQHPVFCFKYLHSDHCLDQCTSDEKISFVERLVKLSAMTWQQIQFSHRHGLGTEKIARNSIKPSVPTEITEDVADFLAFRFNGKRPFVGYRNKFVFHIVYIDRDMTVYKH